MGRRKLKKSRIHLRSNVGWFRVAWDDVLVSVAKSDRLDEFCTRKGFVPEGEAICVGAWPVQFIPAFSSLTEAAMAEADTADYEGIPLCVVQARYLATIALSVGRAKDFLRIVALLETGSTSVAEIETLAARHGLSEAWKSFKLRYLS